jgi:hypothetical protein
MNDPARKAVLLVPTRRRRTMKYICLGYIEPGTFEGMTEDGRHAVLDSFEHNDHLRANGHLVAEVPLQPSTFRFALSAWLAHRRDLP